ncbi:MAG TPA: hypothetical protein VNG51_29725 [Ktedonobacteraceae bacterium]|nr:hypothetical protein [Ktedonobacteraceae bacterium]
MPHIAKRLVIDTDVAIAAGDELPHDSRPKICKDFLIAVFESKHTVVITSAIYTEWQNHPTKFLTRWLASMYKKGKVYEVDAATNYRLRNRLTVVATGDVKRAAMLKDAHLIEAAFQADRIVISMDETVRHCFHNAAIHVFVLKQITWVNPCKDDENAIEWLERGAEREQERCLGYSKDT